MKKLTWNARALAGRIPAMIKISDPLTALSSEQPHTRKFASALRLKSALVERVCQRSPHLSIDRQHTALIVLCFSSVQPDLIVLQIDLVDPEAQQFALTDTGVIGDHQQELQVFRQFRQKCSILFLIHEPVACVVFLELRNVDGMIDQWRIMLDTQLLRAA